MVHPDKNKMEGDSLVWICTILWHDNVTAIISKSHDAIFQPHDRLTRIATILLLKKLAATSLIRPQHGSNSSDGRQVPSVLVRLCLFTVAMFHFEKCCHNAMEKDFSW